MENKNHKPGVSKFSFFSPTITDIGSDFTKLFYNEKYNSDVKKQSKDGYNEYWMDSDENYKTELENAVKQYKKNIKKKDLIEINKNCDEPKAKPKKKYNENETKFNHDVNINGNACADVQELINYFFLREKDKNEKCKSYTDYEKQGAIPKNKGTWRETNVRDKIQFKTDNISLKSNENNSRKSQKKAQRLPVSGIEEKNLNEYIFTKNSNYDEVVVKINEEICSKPFYYVVPENPSPFFFLSRGSYYIIPEPPKPDSKIIFHPENKAKYDSNNSSENLEIKFSEINLGNNHNAVHDSQIHTNNLGKEVFRKLDSHINIGPTDVKLCDSYNNLETNYDGNKIFDKNLLKSDCSNSSMEVQGVSDEFVKLSRKNDEFTKRDFVKSMEEVNIKTNSLLRNEEENSDELISDEEVMASELPILRKFENAFLISLPESPKLDENSSEDIANEYLQDEDAVKNRQMQEQLERMILALPESSLEELIDKCNEFKGNEELVNIYIQETQKTNKIHVQMMTMLFVLPDADPEFLRLEIEKLNGDDDAFNTLICRLLDSKVYPKTSDNPLTAERKKLWQTYVERFSVKNYILKVPKPENFAGVAGDNNKADLELILKFLMSRYPSKSEDFLIQAFESNNKNITKTCESLGELPFKGLSESSVKNEVFSEAFLEEICYIDHRKEIDEYLKEIKERKEIEKEEARLYNSFLSCPLCSDDELIGSDALCCLEGHIFCKDCIKRYIYVKMGDGVYKFDCPLEECGTFFSHELLQDLFPENILSNIISKQQAEEISSAKVDGLEFCPHCEFAYIPNPEDKIFKCQNSTCLIETCRKCGENNHIPLRCEEIERPMDVEARKKIEESMTEKLVRTCPNCQKKFVKIDGCNKIQCFCGAIICYICRKQVSGYEHFSRDNILGKCALYSNNNVLHTTEVVQAGIQTREQILRENQNIRILYDPTISENNQ